MPLCRSDHCETQHQHYCARRVNLIVPRSGAYRELGICAAIMLLNNVSWTMLLTCRSSARQLKLQTRPRTECSTYEVSDSGHLRVHDRRELSDSGDCIAVKVLRNSKESDDSWFALTISATCVRSTGYDALLLHNSTLLKEESRCPSTRLVPLILFPDLEYLKGQPRHVLGLCKPATFGDSTPVHNGDRSQRHQILPKLIETLGQHFIS